ncbi:MAG: excinuclease ABC subunit UvrC [Desulfobulbaceae bacterium]|nr:excinuclease ABC subunit UvrC [Desulfobulbaceae bacterium]
MPAAEPLSPEFLKSVSTGPGVYQMLARKEVLYVGKAVNLRKRLASYKRFSGADHSKTGMMLARVRRIETILTTTEKEALILEASLIKKHRPRYNVILRDDKNYPLIKVTVKDQWPRVLVTRKRVRDGSRYFGPYSSASSMREVLKLLQSLFPLRRCRKVQPRSRPCLNYQIGNCLAPCAMPVDKGAYKEMVDNILMILEGKNHELITVLRNKMQTAAQARKYEEAALYRDQIRELEKTLERQVVVAEHHLDQDVFGLSRKDASVGIAILFVRAGIVSGAQTFHLNDPLGSDEAILAATIIQYYSDQRQPPAEILLPRQPDDAGLLRERLSELRGSSVKLLVPRRGNRVQLMTMARQNAEQIFTDQEQQKKSWDNLASMLQKILHLGREPDHIECVDISNIGGRQAVGSLVCYKDGAPYKAGYRHYRIRGKETPDDYAMMREVLERRLEKGMVEQNLPDLLLLDGGKGQLSLAVDVLDQLGITDAIDLVAIAKEKELEGEKLFRPGRKNPILLPGHSPVLLFLMRVRDEAHRFGITHHRKLRSKSTLASELDALQGIGPQRKKLLLKIFGSLTRLKQATAAEIEHVPGIGAVLAGSIHQQLHQNDETR